MKSLLIVNLLAAVILLSPLNVFAVDSASSPAALRRQAQEERVLERQAKIEERIASKAARLEQLSEQKEARIASKEAMLENRIANTKARIASREAAFKEKIAKFKDQKKADLATKVNTNLNLINQNRSQSLTNHLNSMSEILGRLQTKVTQMSVSGKDVTTANTAIQQAQTAIDAAKSAVTTQSEQDYNIVVTKETKVADDAKITRDKLIADLNATFQLVKEAKQSLVDAIKTSMSLAGGQDGTK